MRCSPSCGADEPRYFGGGYSQRPSHGTLLQHCDADVQSWP
jgi:hypothetical protein